MKHKLVWTVILLALTLTLGACGGGGGSTLTYKVMGTASEANISYKNADGETETETVNLPWETEFGIGGDFSFEIRVENESESGSVTCEIWINGRRSGSTSGVRRVECAGSFSGSKSSYSVDYHGRYDAKPEDAVETTTQQDSMMATNQAAVQTSQAARTPTPAPQETPEAPPAEPAATVVSITDLERYEHDVDCSAYNQSLKLGAFSILYPSGSVIKDCQQDPENYVSFSLDPDPDGQDAAFAMALGHLNFDPPDQETYAANARPFLIRVAGQLQSQLQAEQLNNEPLVYEGVSFYRVDLTAEVEGTPRLLRLVAIPNFEHGHSLFFLAVQRIAGSPKEALPEFDRVTRQIIESVEFPSAQPTIGEIIFAADVTEDKEPIDPAASFPAGTPLIYGIFEYDGMLPGMQFEFGWYLGQDQIHGDVLEWVGEASDKAWVSLDNPDGIASGSYELRLSVDGQLLQTGHVVVEEAASADAETLHDQGMQYSRQGKHAKAVVAFSQAIELDPDYAKAYNNRGVAYMELGDYEQAVADFDQAIDLKFDPLSLAYSNRGLAYAKMDDHERAIADLNQAIELDPDYARAYFNRGMVYEELGELEQAISDYSQSIAIDPRDVIAAAKGYLNRGFVYAKQGDYERAISDYSQAISLRPDWDLPYLDRGLAYAKLGDTEQAIADLRQVLEISTNPDIRQMAEENLQALGVEP